VRLCLRARWDPAARDAVQALVRDGPPDWEVVGAVTRAQALGPLLYVALRDEPALPAAYGAELRDAFYANAARETWFLQALEGILGALGAAGLPAMLLKGAALAVTVYGGQPLRPMGDVDLLLRQEDAAAALAVLRGLGYERVQVEVRPDADLDYRHHAQLRRTEEPLPLVELHWTLVHSSYYRQRLGMDWFWQAALPVTVGAARAAVMRPAAQVLYLCAHLLLHHRGDELLWQHDIAAAIGHYGPRMDWDDLLDGAQRSELVLPLQRVLPALVEEWGVAVPADVLPRLAALRASRGEERVFAALTARGRPEALRFWDDLRGLPGWRPRLRFLAETLFPMPAHMQQRYGIRHRLLLPLYYPYHWLQSWRVKRKKRKN